MIELLGVRHLTLSVGLVVLCNLLDAHGELLETYFLISC